jgi:hypothetical protein
MSTIDPIKEIIEDYEDKISLFKIEREEAIANFKKVVHTRKIEDIKINLEANKIEQGK